MTALAPLAAAVGVLALATALRPRPCPRALAPRTAALSRPRRVHRRHPAIASEQWAALLDAMAADVRGGIALSEAQRRLATIDDRAHRQRRALPDADEAVVRQALAAAAALGGPVAATLDAGAALLRERAAARAEVAVHSAQARLSARVLTAVPLVFAGWSLLTSTSFRAAAFSTPGLLAASVGLVLNLAGWQWMRHLVAGATA